MTTRRPNLLAVLVVAASALLTVGCGGGNETDSSDLNEAQLYLADFNTCMIKGEEPGGCRAAVETTNHFVGLLDDLKLSDDDRRDLLSSAQNTAAEFCDSCVSIIENAKD